MQQGKVLLFCISLLLLPSVIISYAHRHSYNIHNSIMHITCVKLVCLEWNDAYRVCTQGHAWINVALFPFTLYYNGLRLCAWVCVYIILYVQFSHKFSTPSVMIPLQKSRKRDIDFSLVLMGCYRSIQAAHFWINGSSN